MAVADLDFWYQCGYEMENNQTLSEQRNMNEYLHVLTIIYLHVLTIVKDRC